MERNDNFLADSSHSANFRDSTKKFNIKTNLNNVQCVEFDESFQNKLDTLDISIDSEDNTSSTPIKTKFVETKLSVLNISDDLSIDSPELIAAINASNEFVSTPLIPKGENCK